ncbi:MAG: MarR family transcriptional regulator [bacterium]
MASLAERYADRIAGVVMCFDRVVITGTLPAIGYARAMEGHLRSRNVRLFDYPRWAEPLREEIRVNAERLAEEAGLGIEFIRRKNFRKEERVKQIVAVRGEHPGLVHIFSAMEPCPSFKPWHDKTTGKTSLRPTEGKCLHYYFYFIDPELGLCYLRVPTWAPFRLQVYFNGHNQLASRLREEGIDCALHDNAFAYIADHERAQQLAEIRVERLHRLLDRLAQRYCPVVSQFSGGYHWSLMQVEYATDILWQRPADLKPLYDALVRTAVHAVRAEEVATFLGRKLSPQYAGAAGTDFHTRVEGTRIKHAMGKVSIKMYDKHGSILRIETTANDVSFFKHHRRVVHRDGTWETKIAQVKKSIYSLPVLAELMSAANRRYLEYLAALDDPTAGMRDLDRIGKSVEDRGRTWRGFNLFADGDLKLFEAIARGEFQLGGLQNRHLQQLLGLNPAQISRLLKRLRSHGLLKKIAGAYKYYLTKLGRNVVLLALKLRRFTIIPDLAQAARA